MPICILSAIFHGTGPLKEGSCGLSTGTKAVSPRCSNYGPPKLSVGSKTQNILSEDLVCYPGRSVFAKLISFGPVSPPEPAGISELCWSRHAQGKSFLLLMLVGSVFASANRRARPRSGVQTAEMQFLP